MAELPTIVTGSVRADQVLPIKVKLVMRDIIDQLDAEKAWFEYFTRRVAGKMTGIKALTYNFMEQRAFPFTVTCTAIEAIGQTGIAVDHPEYCHTRQLIYNTRSSEFYKMNEPIGGVAVAGEIAVVGISGTGGILKATAIGDVLQILPMTQSDGGALPAAFISQPTARLTYLFQHDKTRGNTDIQRLTEEYGEKQLMIDRVQFYVDQMRGLSMLLYVGQQSLEIVSATGPRTYTMSGIMEQITSNVVDYEAVPGALSLASVGELMRRTMNHSRSSKTKVGVCAQNAWASISAMPSAAIRTTVSETSWGKELKTLITPFGTLAIGYDHILTQENGMADKFFILDPAFIERLYLNGAETHMLMNIQLSTDIHNQVDAITGTDGIRVGLEELHAQGVNIK